GRANGALTAAVHRPGLIPTMRRRSRAGATGSTSSIACGSEVANRARSPRPGRAPPIGDGRRGPPAGAAVSATIALPTRPDGPGTGPGQDLRTYFRVSTTWSVVVHHAC